MQDSDQACWYSLTLKMLELIHAQYLVLLIVVAHAGVLSFRKFKEHRAITALGGYAPKAPAYIPWGQCIEAV